MRISLLFISLFIQIFEKLESDSKATHFYLECVALQKRLKDRERAKVKAFDNLNEAKNEVRSS